MDHTTSRELSPGIQALFFKRPVFFLWWFNIYIKKWEALSGGTGLNGRTVGKILQISD